MNETHLTETDINRQMRTACAGLELEVKFKATGNIELQFDDEAIAAWSFRVALGGLQFGRFAAHVASDGITTIPLDELNRVGWWLLANTPDGWVACQSFPSVPQAVAHVLAAALEQGHELAT